VTTAARHGVGRLGLLVGGTSGAGLILSDADGAGSTARRYPTDAVISGRAWRRKLACSGSPGVITGPGYRGPLLIGRRFPARSWRARWCAPADPYPHRVLESPS